jgi:NAD(P)H dehydrogenase (quinone)
MIIVTAATGNLGRLVVDALLAKLPATEVAVAVRDPAKAADLSARGVAVRHADYAQPATLRAAFAGADKLLLISSNELGGGRVRQHQAAVAAAVEAGVGFLAYTSVLRADRSTLGLAADHLATERAIAASGLPYAWLRNGWYLENYTENLGPALAHGAILGAAGGGKVAAAARRDYAEAAAAVLLGDGHAGRAYELAGDTAFTMAELAAEVARIAGAPVAYRDLPEAAYRDALLGFGLPAPLAGLLADSDRGISAGDLDGDGATLRALIGRPSTTLATAVAAALGRG